MFEFSMTLGHVGNVWCSIQGEWKALYDARVPDVSLPFSLRQNYELQEMSCWERL